MIIRGNLETERNVKNETKLLNCQEVNFDLLPNTQSFYSYVFILQKFSHKCTPSLLSEAMYPSSTELHASFLPPISSPSGNPEALSSYYMSRIPLLHHPFCHHGSKSSPSLTWTVTTASHLISLLLPLSLTVCQQHTGQSDPEMALHLTL